MNDDKNHNLLQNNQINVDNGSSPQPSLPPPPEEQAVILTPAQVDQHQTQVDQRQTQVDQRQDTSPEQEQEFVQDQAQEYLSEQNVVGLQNDNLGLGQEHFLTQNNLDLQNEEQNQGQGQNPVCASGVTNNHLVYPPPYVLQPNLIPVNMGESLVKEKGPKGGSKHKNGRALWKDDAVIVLVRRFVELKESAKDIQNRTIYKQLIEEEETLQKMSIGSVEDKMVKAKAAAIFIAEYEQNKTDEMPEVIHMSHAQKSQYLPRMPFKPSVTVYNTLKHILIPKLHLFQNVYIRKNSSQQQQNQQLNKKQPSEDGRQSEQQTPTTQNQSQDFNLNTQQMISNSDFTLRNMIRSMQSSPQINEGIDRNAKSGQNIGQITQNGNVARIHGANPAFDQQQLKQHKQTQQQQQQWQLQQNQQTQSQLAQKQQLQLHCQQQPSMQQQQQQVVQQNQYQTQQQHQIQQLNTNFSSGLSSIGQLQNVFNTRAERPLPNGNYVKNFQKRRWNSQDQEFMRKRTKWCKPKKTKKGDEAIIKTLSNIEKQTSEITSLLRQLVQGITGGQGQGQRLQRGQAQPVSMNGIQNFPATTIQQEVIDILNEQQDQQQQEQQNEDELVMDVLQSS